MKKKYKLSLLFFILSTLFLNLIFIGWDNDKFNVLVDTKNMSPQPILINPVAGSNIFVSTTGNDTSGTGTIGNPYATLEKALTVAVNGDTIYMRGGTYTPVTQVEIEGFNSASLWLTISGYQNEVVIINGENTPNILPYDGTLDIKDCSRIRITKINITNSAKDCILVDEYFGGPPYSSFITVDNCSFYNSTQCALKTYKANNITFEHNNIFMCFTNWSAAPDNTQETVSFSYPDDFSINNNSFYDCRHMCIDIKAGGNRGIICDNDINNTAGRVSHSGQYWWGSHGIYLDARSSTYDITNVSIFNNNIYGNNSGIVLGSETGSSHFEYIYIYNNYINITNISGNPIPPTGNNRYPFLMERASSPDMFHHVYIYNNLISAGEHNNKYGMIMYVNGFTSSYLSDVYLYNNIFYNRCTESINPFGMISVNSITYSSGVFTLVNNSFYQEGSTCKIDWNGVRYTNVSDPTKFGSNPTFVYPEFIDKDNYNYHITASSPCIDTADTTYVPSFDFDGDNRPINGSYDRGPDEYSPPVLYNYSFEWDEGRGKYPDMIRVNNSEYYAIVGDIDGETGVGTQAGWIYTIEVDNDTGNILQELVDSYQYDSSTAGVWPSICHVYNDIYAISYHDTGPIPNDEEKVITLSISDSDGTISAVIDTLIINNGSDYPITAQSSLSNIIPFGNNIFVISYNGTNALVLKTCYIDNDGNIGASVNDSQIINNSATYSKKVKVDEDTIAIIYQGSGNDGYIVTYNISNTGLIEDSFTDEWEYATIMGATPFIYHVYKDIYVIAYRNNNLDLAVDTVRINNSGYIIKRYIDREILDSGVIQYPYINHMSGNDYVVTHQSNPLGIVDLINISNYGYIDVYASDTFEFNDTVGFYSPVTWCNETYYLIVYHGPDSDGWSIVVDLQNTTYLTPTINEVSPFNNSECLPLSFVYQVNITNLNGSFNYSIECSNGQTTNDNDVNNGDYHLTISNLNYDTQYTVWVNTSKVGSSISINETYYFTTKDEYQDNLSQLILEDSSIMVVFAHNDDWYSTAGTMINASLNGNDVYFLCGSVSSDPDRIITNNWFNSTYLVDFVETGADITNETAIQENISYYTELWTPDIIICYSPYGYFDSGVGSLQHKIWTDCTFRAYENLSYFPQLFYVINMNQDLPPEHTETESNSYPPTDVVHFDYYSSISNMTYWESKIESWERLSISLNDLNTLLQGNETGFYGNNRTEWFFNASAEPPYFDNEYPENNTQAINNQPNCYVTVYNNNLLSMAVDFYENTTGSWVLQKSYTGVSSGSTKNFTFYNATLPIDTYYWMVTANNSVFNTSVIYSFTVGGLNIFGNPDEGNNIDYTYVEHYIRGSWYEMPENGTPIYISAYVHDVGDNPESKTAIYNWGSNTDITTLVASSDEETIDTLGWEWVNWTLNTHPLLEEGEKYFLVLWTDGDSSTYIKYFTENQKGIYKYNIYGISFPSSITGETSINYNYSIYCQYLPQPNEVTNAEAELNDDIVTFNWTRGFNSNRTVVIRNSNHIPTSPTDGTEVYNGTGETCTDTLPSATVFYYKIWSLSEWSNPDVYLYSADGVGFDVEYTDFGLYVNCYDEVSLTNLTFNITIASYDGTEIYENTSCDNTLFINHTLLPSGDDVRIIISSIGYYSRVYVMDLIDLGYYYYLNAYLSAIFEKYECNLRVFTDSKTVTDYTVDNLINFTYTLEDMSSVEVYNNSLYPSTYTIQSYIDSKSVTNYLADQTINHTYNLTDMMYVELFNKSFYGSYGGWVFVSSSNYTYNTTATVVNHSILDVNTTMVRVTYYYLKYSAETGGWIFVPADKYNYTTSNVTVYSNALDENSVMLRVYYYYMYCSGGEGASLYNLQVVETVETEYSTYDKPVENALVNIKKIINGSYTTITSLKTDANGFVNVYLLPNTNYLVTITKSGYNTTISNYIPKPPNDYGQTDEKVFRLVLTDTTPEPPYYIEFEHIIFTASRVDTNLSLYYNDDLSMTNNFQLYVYAINGTYHTTTLIYYVSNITGDDSFTMNFVVNKWDSHYIILFYNHTVFGGRRITRLVNGYFTNLGAGTKLNTLLGLIIGYNPFGWTNFLIFFFLIAGFYYADERDSGKILILLGGVFLFMNIYLGFSSTLFTLAGGGIPILFMVVGVLVIWGGSKK